MNIITWIQYNKLFFSWPDGQCTEDLRGFNHSSPKEDIRAICSNKSYLLSRDFKLIEDRSSHDLNFYEYEFFNRNKALIKKEMNLL